MNSKKERALALIRAEVAKFGRVTKQAIVAYTENRISGTEWQQALNSGYKLYNEKTSHQLPS